MIRTLTGFPGNVVAFSCSGHVTKEDYETVLEPRVDEALAAHDRIRLYYEVSAEFSDVDPGAVWEDIKVGVGHLNRWERMAVVTDVKWIERTIKLFGFMLPGEVRVFPLADANKARAWITGA